MDYWIMNVGSSVLSVRVGDYYPDPIRGLAK